MAETGSEDRTVAIQRSLGMSLTLGILNLLEGDLVGVARMFRCTEADLEPVAEMLRTAPPVRDPARGELQRLIESAVVDDSEVIAVELSDVDGRPAVLLSLGWHVLSGSIPEIIDVGIRVRGAERLDRGAVHARREPDGVGRLPREQFIGSSELRLRRLFAARPHLIEALDRAPRDDCECGFLLQYADGDIYNGGLHQFFSNSTGNVSPWFAEFASRIGARRKGEVMSKAIALFDNVDLTDRRARNARLDAFTTDLDERLDELTGDYYEVDDEDMTDLFAAFVEQHREAFLS